MRLSPAQVGVQLICGHNLPMGPRLSLKDCLREGRDMLVRVSGVDFGYDLQKWHDYLKSSRDGGYTWARTIDLPRVMRAALESADWQAAVQELDGPAQPSRSAKPGGTR